jgi:hypothetical protein
MNTAHNASRSRGLSEIDFAGLHRLHLPSFVSSPPTKNVILDLCVSGSLETFVAERLI